MSEAGKRLIAGATEALAVARGEEPAASITVNGHRYVSAAEITRLQKHREALEELTRYVAMNCYDQWLPEGHAKTSQLSRLLDRCRAALEASR